MVELVTRMMELKKQQARAPKKQSPSARQLLGQKLVVLSRLLAIGLKRGIIADRDPQRD
jgi:hypothetical protein